MRLEVVHTTRYRYAGPVHYGEHRLRFRPRPGHDLRALDDALQLNLPLVPHFRRQPEQPVVVPQGDWFKLPARART